MGTMRIPPGVARGETDLSVPGRFSRVNLIRWVEGLLTPIGGNERITKNPLPSIPRAGRVWLDTEFRHHTAILCESHVIRFQDNAQSDITPSDWRNVSQSPSASGYGSGTYGTGDYGVDDVPRGDDPAASADANLREKTDFPISYTLDNWNDQLLFGSSVDGRVHVWDPKKPTTPSFVSLNSPGLIQTFLVTEEHSLMTFGGGGYPNRVDWSDQNDREGFNYARVEGQAGYFDLEGAGQILSAKRIPGGILVFTQNSVWIGRYLGAPNFYGFTKLAEHAAPISPQAVDVAGARAFWWGRRTFWKYEGGVVTPLPCPIGRLAASGYDADAASRIVCGYAASYPEIWWFYPSAGQTIENPENDRYVVYNFQNDIWYDGVMARTFWTANGVDGSPLAGTADGYVYFHERGFLNAGVSRVGQVWAEVAGLSFEDGDRLHSVVQGQVDTGTNPQNASFTFSGRSARNGPYEFEETYIPRDDGYLDARFTARDFKMRVDFLTDDTCAIGALNFDTKARGKR